MSYTLTSYLFDRSAHHHESEPESPKLFENVDGAIIDRDTGRFASRKEFDKQEKQLTQSIRRF